MNWINFKCLWLLVLVLICTVNPLRAADEAEEEKLPNEQNVDIAETETAESVRENSSANLVGQLFKQPIFKPSVSYNRGQSISHNIGYNLGRTLGKSPFRGVQSVDSQAADSKVVLVLAKDTPETSALPKPDAASLKRLVRNPGFWDDFASQMATFNEQLSQQVPAISRTMGAGLNEFISQTPILGEAQQTGAIDFANLGQTVGQRLLSPLSQNGDARSGDEASDSDASPPPTEAEAGGNELGTSALNPLLDNPLFRNLQQFVPPALPPAPSFGDNPFAFNPMPVPDWSWMGQTPDAAASQLSEVRVKPDAQYPYKIAPKEGHSQKMSEMKLRAALKDALNKKSIPILWFRLPEASESESSTKTPTTLTEEDLLMQSKLEAFQKQLIAELKQLQEVVKLANAMKKAQLEAKGKKSEASEASTPLSLSNTSIYKITLADIEKTLKDEYVRKLLQMIYNSQHKEMQQQPQQQQQQQQFKHEAMNTKYTTDLAGNPNKRQTTGPTEAMSHLSKDDMMKMMAFAYRMAAANGQGMPWLNEEQPAKGMSAEKQQADQRQWVNPNTEMSQQEQRAADAQPQTTMDEGDLAEERKHGKKGHGHHRPPPQHHQHQHQHHHHQQQHHHSPHFPRQWLDGDMQMQQAPMKTMAEQKQRQWLEANGQMPQQPFQQTMPQTAEQRQWLDSNDAMKQQTLQQGPMQTMPEQRQRFELDNQMKPQNFQQAMPQQGAEQRQWAEPNGQMKPQQTFQQTMPQNAEQRQWAEPNGQMKSQTVQQTMPQNAEQRQWVESNGQMKPQQTFQQTMPQNAEQRQWLDTNDQMKQPAMPQMPEQRQWLDGNMPKEMQQDPMANMSEQRQWLDSKMPMKPSAFQQGPEQRQWLDSNAQGQMAMQMRQMPTMNTDTIMQMRQWLDSQAEKKPGQQNLMGAPTSESGPQMSMPMPQQRQMPPQMGRPMEQINPNMQMRQWAAPEDTKPAQVAQPMMDQQQQQQRQMTNEADQQQMMHNDEQPQTPAANSDMARQSSSGAAEPMMMAKMSPANERQMMTQSETGMPMSSGEATPQMPENAGKARHKGFDDFMDDFDLFGHHSNDKKKKGGHGHSHGTVINYYYNAGGSRYPPVYASPGGYAPAPPPRPSYGGYSSGGYGGGYSRPAPSPSYGGGYARPSPPKYSSNSGYYGGGGYGSNAYGGGGGSYRTAVGDDEIQEMLRQHQTMPKMMLLIQKPDDKSLPLPQANQPTTGSSSSSTNTSSSKISTSLDVTSSPSSTSSTTDLKSGLVKSLAKSPKYKSGRRRSRRSAADYATLEPIDESSLNQLRKTYKNTLKEITLNPNETPAEALMRYNAESVREALAKATKEPMEISAGDDDQELHHTVDEGKMNHEATYGSVDSGYATAYNPNLPSTATTELPHAAYHYGTTKSQLASTQVASTQVNGLAAANYANPYQHQQFYTYQDKALPHNPYVAAAYEPASYVEDYATPHSTSPYQMTGHRGAQYAAGLNSAVSAPATALYAAQYAKPAVPVYNPRASQFSAELPHYSNAISKMPASYALPSYSNGNSQRNLEQARGKYVNSGQSYNNNNYFQKSHHSQVEAVRTKDSYQQERSPAHSEETAGDDDLQLESLYEAMKARLSQCCNECKDTLLRDLTKALRKQLGKQSKTPSTDKSNYSRNSKRNQHRLDHEGRHANDDADDQFGDWLQEMVGKGYKKQYLTRDHHRDYQANERLHLAIDERDGAEDIMYGDNQSYKRDTTVAEIETDVAKPTEPETDIEANADIDLMTTEPLNSNHIEKREDDAASETIDPEVPEDVPNAESINEKLESDTSSQESKPITTNASLEPAESTTHSIYALRGKYKPQKNHASNALNKMYGNKIGGYKNLKLLGSSKSLNKSKYLNNDVSKIFSKKDVEKYKNLEEILDLLHELSKARKEMNKNSTSPVACNITSQSTTTETTSTTTTTVKPPKSERKSGKNSTSTNTTVSSSSSTSSPSSEKPKRRKVKCPAKCRKSSKVGDEKTEVVEA